MSPVSARPPVPWWRARWVLALGVVVVVAGVGIGIAATLGAPGPEPTNAASPSPDGREPTPAVLPTPAETPTGPYEPTTAPAVGLDQTADFGTGVTARLVSITAVDGVGQGPGEVGGPSLRLAIELTNGTGAVVSLDTTVVNLYAGPQAQPTDLLAGAGDTLFAGDLEAGGSETAVYVFRVPVELRDRIQVTVTYRPDAATVLFEGVGPVS